MPHFKLVDYSPRFLPIDLSRQLVPGTFEFALHHLLEQQIDLSHIESRYCNEEVGASAYEPRILLKIVLLAYARGILSSRGMEAACRDNVQFIALSGDAPENMAKAYDIAQKERDLKRTCRLAGQLADAYLEIGDARTYKIWKAIEDKYCAEYERNKAVKQ